MAVTPSRPPRRRPNQDEPAVPAAGRRRVPLWLWLSPPIALLGTTASVAGILVDSIYSKETENWAAPTVAQDITNLAAFPALVLLAVLAARGSLRAYLAWLGVLGFSVYSYTIYAFTIHTYFRGTPTSLVAAFPHGDPGRYR